MTTTRNMPAEARSPDPPIGAASMHRARHDGLEAGHHSDPYRADAKWPEPTTCPDCGATVRHGRWTWEPAVPGADRHRCPACARIHDHVPAGELTLSGDFLAGNGEQILTLLRHTEERFRAEHPLERLIDLEGDPTHGTVRATFTGVHLTRGAAQALRDAFEGNLETSPTDADTALRVRWSR
jgi:hypothetical protein